MTVLAELTGVLAYCRTSVTETSSVYRELIGYATVYDEAPKVVGLSSYQSAASLGEYHGDEA
jgi:hypothetical protein